jgi:hypothetical protein
MSDRRLSAVLASVTRFVSLVIVAVLVFGSAGVSEADHPTDSAAYAQEFPADTYFYASIRTDEGYFDALDGILARFHPFLDQVRALAPEDVPPNSVITTEFLLEAFSVDSFGVTWAQGVRPWLGQNIAVAVVPQDDPFEVDAIFAIDITDPEAALDFLIETLDMPTGISSERDGFTVYTVDEFTVVALGERTLYIATREQVIPFGATVAENLKNDADFATAIGNLPETTYNILGYVDIAVFNAIINQSISAVFDDVIQGLDPEAELEQRPEPVLPPSVDMAFGATILDERSLVLDFGIDDAGPEADLLYSLIGDPVDADFARFLPADTSLLIHGKNLRDPVTQVIELAAEDDDTVPQQVQQISTLLEAITGLTYEQTLTLLDGNYALFAALATDADGNLVAVSNALNGESGGLGADFGLVVEVNDAALAGQFISNLQDFTQTAAPQGQLQPGVTVRNETVAGTNALIIDIAAEESGIGASLEVVLAADENVLVLATRDAAVLALNAEGGLAGNPSFSFAAESLLDVPQTVWYMDTAGFKTVTQIVALTLLGPAIGNVFEDIFEEIDPESSFSGVVPLRSQRDQPDPMETIQQVLAASNTFAETFESFTISAQVEADAAYLRLVMTFSD